MTSCRLNNWTTKCEDAVNKQINMEYWASYQYDFIWSYFDRSDIGFKNIAEYFKKASEEEREHAHKLMEYQNLRGGKVVLNTIPDVSLDFLNINSVDNFLLLSFEKALDMEQRVYESLLKMHKTADEEKDPQFADFIEGEFLKEQVEALNDVAKYVSQLKELEIMGMVFGILIQHLRMSKPFMRMYKRIRIIYITYQYNT